MSIVKLQSEFLDGIRIFWLYQKQLMFLQGAQDRLHWKYKEGYLWCEVVQKFQNRKGSQFLMHKISI